MTLSLADNKFYLTILLRPLLCTAVNNKFLCLLIARCICSCPQRLSMRLANNPHPQYYAQVIDELPFVDAHFCEK